MNHVFPAAWSQECRDGVSGRTAFTATGRNGGWGRVSALLAALCCVVLWGSGVSWAQTPAEDDLEKGVTLYRAKEYDNAIDRLYSAIRQMATDPEKQETLARAFLYVGASYLGLGEQTAARQAFVQAVRANPWVATDKEAFSGDVERFFRETRKEIDLSSLPPRPTPTPVPIKSDDVFARSANADLERGVAQALAGESVDAATALWAVIGGLGSRQEDKALRARALLFLALAYARVGREADARSMVTEALTLVPAIDPPPGLFPEFFAQLYQSVRQEHPAQP